MFDIVETSTRPLIVATDVGEAFVKLQDNPEGPHALACELIGTRLAAWLGLPTLNLSLFRTPEFTLLDHPKRAGGGLAIATRSVPGQAWGGDDEQLLAAENPEVTAGLVVIDTWTRNHDRYLRRAGDTKQNFRNVFFTDEQAAPGRIRLLAMDFTECIKCGSAEVGSTSFGIAREKDDQIYGLFPAFIPFVTRAQVQAHAATLARFRQLDAESVVAEVPPEWHLTDGRKKEVVGFLVGRAAFLAHAIEEMLETACGWKAVLPSPTQA